MADSEQTVVDAGGRVGRVGRPMRSVVQGMAVGAVLALLVVVFGLALVGPRFSLGLPFGTETKEVDHSAVLVDLRDVSRFEAAVGQYQVVVDVEHDVRYLPSWLAGERITFMAEGEVTATVDFRDLSAGAVRYSADGARATITLAPPELSKPRIDPDRSEVISHDRGLANRVAEALSDPGDDQDLYQRATEKLAASAERSGLEPRARRNTRRMLETLLEDAGIEQVTVIFQSEASA